MRNGAASPGLRRVKFGDVVRLVKARCQDPLAEGHERYVGLEHIEPEELRIRSWGNVADGTTFTSVFRPGQVLFGKRRAYQRKVAVADFSGVCSGDIYVLESSDPDVLLPELLPFICQTEAFFRHAVGTSAGSLSPRTNWTSLAAFEFALPPIGQQRRIAESINAVEEQRIALGDLRSASQTLFNAGIDDCLSRFGEPYLCPVDSLVIEGPKNGVSPKVNADNRGYPTLSISAIRNGRVEPEGSVKYADLSEDEARKFGLKIDDVLIVRGNGNRLLTGKCGVVGEFPAGCFYPDLLIKVRFDPSTILTPFAVAQWNSPRVHSRLISRAKSTNGIWKVNGADIRKHTLIVPPIKVQKEFLKFSETLANGLDALDNRVAAADAVKSDFLNSIVCGSAV